MNNKNIMYNWQEVTSFLGIATILGGLIFAVCI